VDKYFRKLSLCYVNYEELDAAPSDGIKKVREFTNLPEITVYWARHSFATLSRNECRMSMDDVSQALNDTI